MSKKYNDLDVRTATLLALKGLATYKFTPYRYTEYDMAPHPMAVALLALGTGNETCPVTIARHMHQLKDHPLVVDPSDISPETVISVVETILTNLERSKWFGMSKQHYCCNELIELHMTEILNGYAVPRSTLMAGDKAIAKLKEIVSRDGSGDRELIATDEELLLNIATIHNAVGKVHNIPAWVELSPETEAVTTSLKVRWIEICKHLGLVDMSIGTLVACIARLAVSKQVT